MSTPEPTTPAIASAAITTPEGWYIPRAFRTDPEDAALADLTRFVHEPTTPPPSATMNARIRQAAKRGAP